MIGLILWIMLGMLGVICAAVLLRSL